MIPVCPVVLPVLTRSLEVVREDHPPPPVTNRLFCVHIYLTVLIFKKLLTYPAQELLALKAAGG